MGLAFPRVHPSESTTIGIYTLLHIRIHRAGKTLVPAMASSPRMSNGVGALASASTLTVPLQYTAVGDTGHSSNDPLSRPNRTQEIEIPNAELPPATPCPNC